MQLKRVNVVQLQTLGPHVTSHNVFSDPQKHSGKIFKSEMCWKACEVTFVSRNCFRWIKCICTRKWIIPFLCTITVIVLFIFWSN